MAINIINTRGFTVATIILLKTIICNVNYIFSVIFVLCLSFYTNNVFSHEAWLLTPEQIIEWNKKPRPLIFTEFTKENIFIISYSLLFLITWIWLDSKGTFPIFKKTKEYLINHKHTTELCIRWTLATMLLIAALGLNPRSGTELFEVATLVAPDLEIRLLDNKWHLLFWVQVVTGIALILGFYIRVTSFIVLVVIIFGISLFGYQFWAYAGITAASAIYLLLHGSNKFHLTLWTPKKGKLLISWFDNMPPGRAQFLLRLLLGFNLVYLGIEYKFFHPNLSIAFLELENVYTFGLTYTSFVFNMFLVETIAGLLMIFGILIRPLSVILFLSFVLISYITDENPLGHIIIYGALYSCLLNGKGSWSINTMPVSNKIKV